MIADFVTSPGGLVALLVALLVGFGALVAVAAYPSRLCDGEFQTVHVEAGTHYRTVVSVHSGDGTSTSVIPVWEGAHDERQWVCSEGAP